MGASLPTSNMLTARNPFTRIAFLTIFALFLFIYTFRPTTQRFSHQLTHLQNGSHLHQADCTINATYMQSLQERYKLGDKVDYGRRYVRFHRQDIERQSLTKVDKDLFPKGFDLIDIQNPPMNTTCLKPLEVPVPRSSYPSTVDASDFLFGVSTTFKRLTDPKIGPMEEWAHWLTDGKGKSNGAGLILRLIDATESEMDEAKHTMTAMGIDVQVFPSDSNIEMAKRYLSLLPALYADSTRKSRKWLVMCDDDTFFPSMHALIRKLSTYDHNTDLYIGTFSEDVNNIERHGSQAFGGAGVFFSLSVAEKVAKLYDECSTPEKIQESNTGWGPQGDILLRKCIYEHTEVRLTLVRQLHQLDIQGDPSGFYEAGLAPLSLHHFKGGIWHSARPYQGAQIIHTCGEACFLQRFQTSDDFIISNGYSVAYYPKGIDFNTHQVERTFSPAPDDHGWNLDFMLGPQRKNLLWTGRKASWELKESIPEGNGLRQVYVRKGDDSRWTEGMGGEAMFQRDGVVELIWIP
jgi:hypothetical protein